MTSSSFPTEPSYIDIFNLLPTQKFLEEITTLYIEGTNPDSDITLSNGTLTNGTFIATFTNSFPDFIGDKIAGFFCTNNQTDVIGSDIVSLKPGELIIEYSTTTASYNISLNKRFKDLSQSPQSFALGVDSGTTIDIIFVGKIETNKLRNLAPMKQRFLNTFQYFFGNTSEYEWYAGLSSFPEPLNINNSGDNFVVLNSTSDFIDNLITQGGTFIGSGVGLTNPELALAQHHKYNESITDIIVYWNESSTCVTSFFNETSFNPSQADLLYDSMFIFGYSTTPDGADTLVAFAGTTPETGILPYAKGDNQDENLIDYYSFYPKINIHSTEVVIF